MPIRIPWLRRVNGKQPEPARPPVAAQPPVVVQPEKPLITRTMNGWPQGKQVDTPDDWQVRFNPLARAKLDIWDRGSDGLEVSGYAVLDKPVKADPAKPYTFYVKDILLVCAIEESTGGYTEMPAELRAQAMMEIVKGGNKPNATGWWHKHPVSGWSPIDVDTLRQRVHEMGMNEVLECFAFVLTPTGIRARWDRSGPNPEDNIYIDRIPVQIGTPEMLEELGAAQREIDELVAKHPRSKRKPQAPQASGIDVPQASWTREVTYGPFDMYDEYLVDQAMGE